MTMNNTSSTDIRFSYNRKRPFKKVHQIANRTFIVIDETLVEFLSINENNTWLEQQAIEDGILMKIHHLDDENNYDSRNKVGHSADRLVPK